MVAAAFIIVLVALGFARSLRRHHLAQLTVEQKAAVTDATAADPVWPIIAFILLLIFPLRILFARLSLDNRIQGAIYLFTAIFLVSVAVSIAQQLRLLALSVAACLSTQQNRWNGGSSFSVALHDIRSDSICPCL